MKISKERSEEVGFKLQNEWKIEFERFRMVTNTHGLWSNGFFLYGDRVILYFEMEFF